MRKTYLTLLGSLGLVACINSPAQIKTPDATIAPVDSGIAAVVSEHPLAQNARELADSVVESRTAKGVVYSQLSGEKWCAELTVDGCEVEIYATKTGWGDNAHYKGLEIKVDKTLHFGESGVIDGTIDFVNEDFKKINLDSTYEEGITHREVLQDIWRVN